MVRGNHTVNHCALVTTMCLISISLQLNAASLADFDELSLSAESCWNGSDLSGGFLSGGATFNNNYNSDYGSWDGWAYSNRTNDTTVLKGLDGQYTAITGAGYDGSSNYGVAYCSAWAAEPATITLTNAPAGITLTGAYVTNNNYAYYSMLEGEFVAKKFGGADGADPDWLLLTITGLNADGLPTGAVPFYLADFTAVDSADDYIVSDWTWVDLSGLGAVTALQFSMSSSDTDPVWGMNTPSYFAMDSLIPEPATVVLLGMGALLAGRRRRRGSAL